MLQNHKKVLVIGHVWPQPNATAAGEHIMHIIELFEKLNYYVHFITAAQAPNDYNYDLLLNRNISYLSTALNDDNFNNYVAELNPTVVLYDRFMVEEQFSWRVKNHCPNAIHVLDTEDLHFLRKKRKLKQKESQESELSDIAKRELASIYRCDLSLIISEVELKLLNEEYNIPNTQLFYLPLLTKKIDLNKLPEFEKRKHLVFVGNFLHEPNWHAVQKLKKEIWPKLLQKNKKIALHIYGAYATQKHLQLNNPKQNFYVNGYVEDLDTIIQNSKLLIAPLFFGAGQKGKLLKAMQNGTPSITTTIGAEAMHFENEWPGMITDDLDSFIDAILKLYSDSKVWKIKQNKISPLVVHFGFEKHFLRFQNRIELLNKNYHKLREENIVGSILWHHSMRSTEFMSRWIMEKNKQKE